MRCPKFLPLRISISLTVYRLCAVFGITSYTSTGNEYESSLSTTWGSFAYLIGSMLQWYEAVNKHSVQDLFDGAAEVNAPQLQPLGRGVSERTEAGQEIGAPVMSNQTSVSPTNTRQPAREPEKAEQQLESEPS